MKQKILYPLIPNELNMSFNVSGREMHVIESHLLPYQVIKLAFSWNIGSVYQGSRLKHLLKRFFTSWRIREYETKSSYGRK